MDEKMVATDDSKKGAGMGLFLGVAVLVLVAVIVFSKFNKTNKTEKSAMQTETKSTTQTGASETPALVETSDITFQVEGGMFYFKPNEIRVKKGQKVKVVFTNAEGMHDFVIDELNVKSLKLGPKESTEFEFVASKAGTFEFYCSVMDHRAKGMKGKLIVE